MSNQHLLNMVKSKLPQSPLTFRKTIELTKLIPSPNGGGLGWGRVKSDASLPFDRPPPNLNTVEISRHTGMDCRYPEHRDVNLVCPAWLLGSGNPCRNDEHFLNSTALPPNLPPLGRGTNSTTLPLGGEGFRERGLTVQQNDSYPIPTILVGAKNWKQALTTLALLTLSVVTPTLLNGCATLNKDQVKFSQLSDCPKYTVEKLTAEQASLGPMTDTHTLACALDFLRNAKDPSLTRSALGSRLLLNLAERETDPDKRDKLAGEGVGMAEAALAAGGEGDGAVHYYLAANLGLAVRDHPTLALDNLKRLEQEMKKAMELTPDIDSGGPLRLLGTLYSKAPAWPDGIGDRDKGVELLAQAVNKFPNHPLNHLFYAEALLAADDNGAMEKAKAQFSIGENVLAQGNWGYSLPSWQKEFADLRDEIGDVPANTSQSAVANNKK